MKPWESHTSLPCPSPCISGKMWWYPTVKMSRKPTTDTGQKKNGAASANRMITPDHLALVTFCTATKAKLPPVRPVKYTQLTWKRCQARSACSPRA